MSKSFLPSSSRMGPLCCTSTAMQRHHLIVFCSLSDSVFSAHFDTAPQPDILGRPGCCANNMAKGWSPACLVHYGHKCHCRSTSLVACQSFVVALLLSCNLLPAIATDLCHIDRLSTQLCRHDAKASSQCHSEEPNGFEQAH